MEKIADSLTPSARYIAAHASAQTRAVLHQHIGAKSYLLVCDDATWVACGQAVYLDLLAEVKVTPYSLGRNTYASMETCEKLIPEAAKADALIAVGSGTINDITKYVATQLGKPYLCVATAASMNGYTSATASLEHNQFKHSYPAKPPLAVIADLTVITAAPRKLGRAGLGDTLCRSSVESDMLLAHYLFDAPYPREAFDQLRVHEAALIAEAPRFKQGDPAYFAMLITALLDSGDWMAKFGSSAVASQGEHMIVHTAELMYGAEMKQLMHGELVALATLTNAALQEKMLLGQPAIKAMPREESQFIRQFGSRVGPDVYKLYAKKAIPPEQLEAVNARLLAVWPEMKAAILAIQQPVGVLERLYRQINLPTSPRDMNLDVQRYEASVTYAHMTRDRFTFLDLAAMNGRRAS